MSDQENSKRNTSDEGPTWKKRLMKTLVFCGCTLLGGVAIDLILNRNNDSQTRSRVIFSVLRDILQSGALQSIQFEGNEVLFSTKNGNKYITSLIPGSQKWLWKMLSSPQNESVQLSALPPKSRTSLSFLLDASSFVLSALTVLYYLHSRGVLSSPPQSPSPPPHKRLTFNDLIGHQNVKEELLQIVSLLSNPQEAKAKNINIPKGLLLEGEPGCGKTMIAKIVASLCHMNFIYVSSSSLVELYVGNGSQKVRSIFQNARKTAPCIIFFDEIDSIGSSRHFFQTTSHEYTSTLNELLTEMDGMHSFYDSEDSMVFVIAATNRVSVLDEALLRSGRFDKIITIEKPTLQDRVELFRYYSRGKSLASSVNFLALATVAASFTGADIATVMNEAALLSFRLKADEIDNGHIVQCIQKVAQRKTIPTHE